jgi:peptide/nickel transport system substrate-binding protein
MKRFSSLAVFLFLGIFGEIAGHAATVEKPMSGGTLRFGTQRDISALNPFQDTRSIEHGVRSLIYEPLLTEEDYKIKPYLAESWEISKDGKEYTFRLKHGIKFHNGKEMTAQDVYWSVSYTMNPKNRAYGADKFKGVKSVQLVDNSGIRIVLNEPGAPFLSHLTSIQGLPVVPKESLAQGEKPQRFPPGTGPFVFEEWKPEQRIELRRFTDYWQRGLPHVDRLIIRPVRDDEVRLTALRSGDLDVIDRVAKQSVDKIKKGQLGDLKLVLATAAGLRPLIFNVSKPPFDKVEVRQAVAYAIDKEEIIKGAYWGLGIPINQKFEPSSPWYFKIPDRKRDLAKAKALLEKAGYPRGFRTKANVFQGTEDEMLVVQGQLREIGIETEIDIVPFATAIRNMKTGDFTMGTYGGDISLDPDTNYYPHYRSEETVSQNFSRYKNPRVDQLLDEGRISLDPKKRQQIYREFAQITSEELPVIWMALTPYVYAHAPHVKGFDVEPQGLFFSGDKGIPMIWLNH